MKDKELRKKVDTELHEISNITKNIEIEINKKMDKLDLVECEKCGCLLKKETAIKGKSEVREEKSYIMSYNDAKFYEKNPKEYIHIPYYCKVHKPKN